MLMNMVPVLFCVAKCTSCVCHVLLEFGREALTFHVYIIPIAFTNGGKELHCVRLTALS